MSGPLRVLLIEDSDTDAKLVARALRPTGREVRIVRVEDPDAMRDALASATFDLIISDWSLPHFSAPDALKLLQATHLDLPFIIVSGTIGEEIAVTAMRAGAHDYVLKDKLTRLAPAVERELRECEARAARRVADEALRRLETRFRELIERSDDGIVLADSCARILYMSSGGRRIFGMAEDAALGEPIGNFIHPDDRARVAMCGARIRATPGTSETHEFRIIRQDGATRWQDVTLVNRLDESAVAAVVVNFRDITDRKQALDELRESELRFRRLWESGLFGIAVTDSSGACVEANAALLDIVGYSREDLVAGDVRWPEMTPPEWQSTTAVALEQLRLLGRATPWEKEYFRKDGSRVPVLIGIASLAASRNVSMVIDLSAQKAAEADRRRAEAALEDTEAQLRQSQKMDAIGRLAGGVAHDFNNLLSVILSYGDLALADLPDGDPLRDDIGEICKAGRRAAELTSQLLIFSRQQVIEPTLVDLDHLLGNMEKMLRRVLGEDIELVTVSTPMNGLVMVDKGSLEQVVMNLAVNARDAMPTGGRLVVETGTVVLDDAFARTHVGVNVGPHVMLSVRDTGTGMDRATQARIFEPFFTTKAVGKGTGLGLSTVFGIVQQSGGTVWVESESGKGTTFKVYLPQVAGEVDRQPASAQLIDLRGTETILLVEDEDAVRVVARGILQRFGYQVIEARNAGEAFLYAESHIGTIDLLLTDVVMPQMSGPALAQRLAVIRPNMKVICMSGYTDDSIVRHGVRESEIAYLQKPITPERLTRKVRRVLDAAPRGAGAQPRSLATPPR